MLLLRNSFDILASQRNLFVDKYYIRKFLSLRSIVAGRFFTHSMTTLRSSTFKKPFIFPFSTGCDFFSGLVLDFAQYSGTISLWWYD
jgi:hypothetical protein